MVWVSRWLSNPVSYSLLVASDKCWSHSVLHFQRSRMRIGRVRFLRDLYSVIPLFKISWFLFSIPKFFVTALKVLHDPIPSNLSTSTFSFTCTQATQPPCRQSPISNCPIVAFQFLRKSLDHIFLCKSYPRFKAKIQVHLCQQAVCIGKASIVESETLRLKPNSVLYILSS